MQQVVDVEVVVALPERVVGGLDEARSEVAVLASVGPGQDELAGHVHVGRDLAASGVGHGCRRPLGFGDLAEDEGDDFGPVLLLEFGLDGSEKRRGEEGER